LFKSIKKALGSITAELTDRLEQGLLYRRLTESDLSGILDEFLISLVESEVAYEVAEDIVTRLKSKLEGMQVKRGTRVREVVRDALKEVLLETLGRHREDLAETVSKHYRPGDPYKIVFVGVNGVGKTTTIAKVAYRIKSMGLTPLIAAADTFRAGAQEQLSYHASRLGVPILKGRYGSDPASVAFDAVEHARSRGYACTLIDTAGRMHVDRDLMDELRKIVRVVKPHEIILVVDALTGNDAAEQAREFNEGVGITGSIVTKVDADLKGGVTISVAAITKKPILYLGVGQRYEDLVPFNPQKFVDELLAGI